MIPQKLGRVYLTCSRESTPINKGADILWICSSQRGDDGEVFQQREEQISVRFSAALTSKKINASKSETAAFFKTTQQPLRQCD